MNVNVLTIVAPHATVNVIINTCVTCITKPWMSQGFSFLLNFLYVIMWSGGIGCGYPHDSAIFTDKTEL